MSENVFDFKSVFLQAWNGFSKNAIFFIVLLLAMALCGFIASLLFMSLILIPIGLIFILAEPYLILSFIKASLMIVKGENVSWDILKIDFSAYLKFLGFFIIFSIILSIVPFIIAAVFFGILGVNSTTIFLVFTLVFICMILITTVLFPAPYMIVDKQAGIIEVFHKSIAITKPAVVSCLILLILFSILGFIGSIPLGLGLFITIPMTYIGLAAAYKALDSEKPASEPASEPAAPATSTSN